MGLGCFLFWSSRDAARTLPGLVALLLGVGGVGAFRLLGMVVDGTPNAYHLGNFTLEVATTVLVLTALSRHQRVAPVSA